MSSGSVNEKTEQVIVADQTPAKKGGFFSRKGGKQDKVEADTKQDATEVHDPANPALKPVGIGAMFRYAAYHPAMYMRVY